MKSLIVIFILLFSVSLSAFEGKADFGSDFYFYESDTVSHSKFYQSVKASLTFKKDNFKKFSFHTYGRWRTDFSNKESHDPQLYMYDAYFKLSNYISNTKINIGRQFAFTSSGTALVDGVGVDAYLTNKLQVKVTAGSFVDRIEPDKLQNFSENFTTLSRLVYNFGKFKTGLNYVYKKRFDETYTHHIGVDFSIYKNNYSLYSRGAYDIELRQYHEFLIRGSIQKNKIYLGSEFLHKKPSVSPNSVFAIIDANNYNRIRFDIQYRLNPKLKLISQFRNSFFDDENIIGGYLGITISHFTLMYNYQNGQGTENSGFSGTVSQKFNNTYSVYGTANLHKYKIQDEIDESLESYATAFGVARPIGKAMYFRIEYQYLRNAVESSNQRVYLKLNRQVKF